MGNRGVGVGGNINVTTKGREFEGVCWTNVAQNLVQLLSP